MSKMFITIRCEQDTTNSPIEVESHIRDVVAEHLNVDGVEVDVEEDIEDVNDSLGG